MEKNQLKNLKNMKKLRYKKSIAIITSSRAEYGLFANLIKIFKKQKIYDFTLLIAGQHLSTKYGKTISQFLDKDINSVLLKTINSKNKDDDIPHIFHKSFEKVSDYLRKNKCDLLILLGDRYETLAFAAAASLNKVKIAHIHGEKKLLDL